MRSFLHNSYIFISTVESQFLVSEKKTDVNSSQGILQNFLKYSGKRNGKLILTELQGL